MSDATKTIKSVRVSDGGRYWCRAKQGNYYSQYSNAAEITVKERPKPVVGIDPDRHVFRGETVTLTCDIQQTGDWEYTWNKDNKQDYIIGQDQKYIITSVDWFHSGVYSCRGTQSEAPTYSQMSDGVTLTVSDKLQPTLTVNPQRSVFTGDTVTLSCDVGQLTGWTIHWIKDSNTDCTGDATKTIKSVRVSDGGRYQCRAQRGIYYGKYSNAVDITVRERPKPVVGVDPDRHVFRGETVTLTCDIQQTGDWKYSWNKDNTHYCTIGQDQKYIITSVDWSHSGVYSCRGTQSEAPAYSQMSDGVTLTVSDKPQPTLTINPQSLMFTGDTVSLSCDVGQLTGWKFFWTKDLNFETMGDATKMIKSLSISDGGKYWCRAKRGNYDSEYSNAVEIIVKERPKPVVGVNPDRHVFRGETVTLICDIQQTGEWEYSWNKDNTHYYSTGQNQKYIITSVDWSHSGVYSCRGTQSKAPAYSQMSDGVTLTVSDKPQPTLTVNPQRSLFTGDTVTLSCDVGQLTGWTIHWIKDSNTDFTSNTNKTIESVTISDGGSYWCIAQREYYYTKYSNAAKITVRERPKPVVGVDPDRHVFRGETVTLTCDIQQTGDWEYSWYKDNKQDYIIRQDQKYIISSVDWSHSGVYSCRRTQSKAPAYSQMSDGVTLTVSDKPQPTLTVNPQSLMFTGDTVSLSCDVGQLTGWNFFWTKDLNFETMGDATKMIKSVSISDGGKYWCRAKRGNYDSEYSNAVEITVKERPKPVVGVNPDRHVFRGETVTLICDIQQTGEWEYSWNKDNTHYYSTGQNQKYIITSVDWSHSGVYSCRGTQSEAPTYSQMSDGVTLTVSDKPQPTLTVNPQRSLFTGDTVTLSCDVGQLTGWTIHWIKDSNTDFTSNINKTIESVTISDGGSYWCIAQREYYYSKYSNAAKITVRERPKPVVGVDPDRHVFRGETVTLTCDIQQTGDWEYSWNKDNKQDYIIRQDQKYIITSVDWSHSGVYSCRGTQSEAPTYSQISDGVTLTVSDLPTSTLTVTPKSILTGETANLTCVIESNHRDWRYEWYKDSVMLNTSDHHTVNRDTLTIRGSTESDAGQYWCRGQREERPSFSQKSNQINLSINVSRSDRISVFNILRFLLKTCPYLLSTVMLLFKYYRERVTEDRSQIAVPEEQTYI
ncbi:titin-like isoform X2 [Puntigrus tetrazona]|nr:titin-like isoform X2 [Puntigrus tetrazona]